MASSMRTWFLVVCLGLLMVGCGDKKKLNVKLWGEWIGQGGVTMDFSASGLVHLPGCEQYDCPQCRIEFKDVQVAREAGFKPCPFCRTLVDEQERQLSDPADS